MREGLPPGPSYPAVVQGIGFWTRPLPFLERCRARYGKRFTIRLPLAPPFVNLTDPAEVKQVFTAPPDVLHPGQGGALPLLTDLARSHPRRVIYGPCMAQIAEDLLLLLLDNASAQPALERDRRERVLAAAVLLDLAHACRVRPAMPGDAVEPGLLVALAGSGPTDSVVEPAFELLRRRPLPPAGAVAKVGKHVQENLFLQLEQLGQIRRVRLQSKVFTHPYAWPLTNRDRVAQARAALLSALFDRRPPTPATAGIVTLLHAADGLGALLSLNDRGWRWVHTRAGEIASGSWVDEYPTALPEVNLAVTASALRSTLA